MASHRNSSASTLLALCAAGTFVYGVERWRHHAAARATHGERDRFHALVVCLLGRDGEQLVDSPSEARRRLRALAMQTPLVPAPTWLDRCLPLARTLAVHGDEVDATGRVGGAGTHVASRAQRFALALGRIGVVWQVRAGDPDADMDPIADLLARTSAEIGLAGTAAPTAADGDLRAPVPAPFPVMARLTASGLVPLPLGSPARFLVGAPLPLVSAVSPGGSALRLDVVANTEARYWSLTPQALVRIAPDGAPDGLSPVQLDGPDGRLGQARVAAPPADTDRAAFALDAMAGEGAGGVLWLAEAVRGHAPVLARLARGAPATAVLLAPTPGEEVAVGTDGRAVLAAYTWHADPGSVQVAVVRAADGARAAVVPVGETWTLAGHHARLAFCRTGTTTWLLAAGRDEWRVGTARGDALTTARDVRPPPGYHFDEAITVRCSPQGLLAYGRERPRTSPLLHCRSGAPGTEACVVVPPVPSPQPADLPDYVTDALRAGRVAHPEWPLAVAALADGTLVAARAAGTIAAVTRLPPGGQRWLPERVVLDAAAGEHGALVRGVELYAAGARVLLAVATAGELRAAASDDGGASWHAP